MSAKKTGDAEFELNGRKVSCQVRQISIEGTGTTYEGTVYINPTLSPYVLRKEGTLTNTSDSSKSTINIEVFALAPIRVSTFQTERI